MSIVTTWTATLGVFGAIFVIGLWLKKGEREARHKRQIKATERGTTQPDSRQKELWEHAHS